MIRALTRRRHIRSRSRLGHADVTPHHTNHDAGCAVTAGTSSHTSNSMFHAPPGWGARPVPKRRKFTKWETWERDCAALPALPNGKPRMRRGLAHLP